MKVLISEKLNVYLNKSQITTKKKTGLYMIMSIITEKFKIKQCLLNIKTKEIKYKNRLNFKKKID